MSKSIRSAKGDLVNFELLAIKSQLASAPVPKKVEERIQAIEEKDGVRTSVVADVDFLAVSSAAAAASASQGTQSKRK